MMTMVPELFEPDTRDAVLETEALDVVQEIANVIRVEEL